MKHVVIAPFESDSSKILAGVREFPTEKVVLLVPSAKMAGAREAQEEFARFMIPTEILELNNAMDFEEVFEKIAHIKAKENGKGLLINLGSSTGILNCISLSAAFVNGLRAFEVMGEKLVMFPILKFSYYDMLSDKKLRILSLLGSNDCCKSLEELSKHLKLGPSLVNYHVYGDEKNPGLKELGLVEAERAKGKVTLTLTPLGRLLLKDKQAFLPEARKHQPSAPKR